MPQQLTYPGVYIEEIPSGVRTITGVATSIAAFIGWATKGPTDKAQRVLSWPDFERRFGGLDIRSPLGYAVYSFFANGGRDAYVIRLANESIGDEPADEDTAIAADQDIDGKLTLTALSPGEWGNHYGFKTVPRSDDATRFRLQVLFFNKVDDSDEKGVVVESFENLSMDKNDRRYAVKVINEDSEIIKAALVGTPDPNDPPETGSPIPRLIDGNDGAVLETNTGPFETRLTSTTGGVNLLERVDLFNLLCVPGETAPATLSSLEAFCRDHRAFLIADCAANATFDDLQDGPDTNLTGDDAINAAFYFPWLWMPDPLQENRPREAPPCGFIAGIYSRTDASRGVFKAPAGIDASLTGVLGVTQTLTDDENGVLNPMAVNCIRTFPVYGTVVWGARTLRGNDQIGSEWKYIPVRRMALFIEESLYRGTKWVVFEPNDEPLWAQIRLNIGAFMHNLFRQGAFQGSTPREAYFVKCDKETTTQNDINLGIVNIIVGFAPLKPAEFVVIKIQQMAGEIQT
jgi:phage tail sheath protein FI